MDGGKRGSERSPLAKKSPSLQYPVEANIRIQSLARSSRAGSEARSELLQSPDDEMISGQENGLSSPSGITEAQMAEYRRSRAGSEAPSRNVSMSSPLKAKEGGGRIASRNASVRSSRAGSEVPDRDVVDGIISQRSSRAGSEAPERGLASPATGGGGVSSGVSSAKRVVVTATGSVTPSPVKKHENPVSPGTRIRLHQQPNYNRSIYSTASVNRHLEEVERDLYHTVESSTGMFRYFQRLNYPLDSEADKHEDERMRPTIVASIGALDASKEPSPHPRHRSGSAEVSYEGSSGTSPSPTFDEAAFNALYDTKDVLGDPNVNMNESFSFQPPVDEAALQSVSVLAMTTLPDPMSGAPLLGLCLGDYSGGIEYYEVATSEASNKRIRSSRGATNGSRSTSSQRKHRDASSMGSRGYGSAEASASVETAATNNSMAIDMRGREVVRQHSHKAYIKTINPLTSVAVEPSIKCLAFVRPHSSPSMISYLAANERVIKLFHVRREGFSPFGVFPHMATVLGQAFVGSRYCARLPPQTAIVPVKEFGPTANSIQALSVSADGKTFISVEDLQVFWWDLEATDTTKGNCIADLRPPSGALEEVEELVTAASFHPTHSSLFLLTRSSGVLNIGDLRDPPSREHRQFAITTQIAPSQNPTSCPSYDEILCSISAASFLGPDHVVTRDYLSLKLWDLRKPSAPYAMVPVMHYVSPYLNELYVNDSIFDRFPVAVDDVSGTVVTGLYDGAVAVWQPLGKTCRHDEGLLHYRVDPEVQPSDAANGSCVSVKQLEETLSKSWETVTAFGGDGMAESTPLGSAGGVDEHVEVPEPFTNKVLNIAIAPGGERFAYTYKNGKLVYVLERKSKLQSESKE